MAGPWRGFWERLAHHFGGGWPELVPPVRPTMHEGTPDDLHRQLDALEARLAQRRLRVLDAEGERLRKDRGDEHDDPA